MKMIEKKIKDWTNLLKVVEMNISEINEDLQSCLARLQISEMTLHDLIEKLEEYERKD